MRQDKEVVDEMTGDVKRGGGKEMKEGYENIGDKMGGDMLKWDKRGTDETGKDEMRWRQEEKTRN